MSNAHGIVEYATAQSFGTNPRFANPADLFNDNYF